MKTCDTCGEPIAAVSGICPYCETPQRPDYSQRRGPALRTINLEDGLPTVEEALRRLSAQLDRVQQDGASIIRVIHGWGAGKGGGGKIRPAARRWIQEQAASRRIRGYLFGDHFSHTLPEGRDLIRRHPELRQSEPQDRHNPGITFIEL